MPTRIIVGQEYRESFDSVVKLIESGCLDDKKLTVSKDGKRRIISDGTYTYALGSRLGDDDDDDIYIDSRGASWFSVFRGGDSDNQSAAWVRFLDAIAGKYHKKYSLVEFTQKKLTRAEIAENERIVTEYASNIVNALFSGDKDYSVRPLPADESTEDVYGVSMRLELSAGTGVAVPVLAKVYFRKDGRKMTPLRRVEAEQIDEYLKTVEPGEAAAKTGGIQIIDAALNALENLVQSDDGAGFVSAMCFGDKRDEDEVNRLCNTMASAETVMLECTRVKVLGASHVKWYGNAAEILSGTTPVLRLSTDLGGQVTLECIACSSGARLISGNAITYIDGRGDEQNVTVDPTRADLGLSSDEVDEIKQYSELSKHLMRLSCGDRTGAGSCSRVVCAANALTFDVNGKKVYCCRDCPHPEMLYSGLDPDGTPRYTASLKYAVDKSDLAEESTVDVCECCGRSFSAETINHRGVCEFCAATKTGNAVAARAYRKYASVLPLWARMSLSRKYCYEDDEILLFVVGNNRWIFSKLDVSDRGYLSAPVKVTKRF